MKIVVAIADAKERKRIVSVLAIARHEVVEAATSVALASMLDQSFDVAFVEPPSIGRLRSAATRIFAIGVVGGTPSEIGAAYAAGADDVMRASAPKEEILGRAGSLERIMAWACPARSPSERLSAYSAWTALDRIVGTELGEMIGEAMATAPFAPGAITNASAIPLTFSAERIQIRLGIGLDADSALAIQSGLLGGDVSGDAMADAMREIANTAGGALKRAALANGVELTIGLPTNGDLFTGTTHEHAWLLHTASGVTLRCCAIVTSLAPRVVPGRDLREGMVLARDVRNPMGVLILPAGTSLTRTTVEQLGRLLGSTAAFEVTDAAA